MPSSLLEMQDLIPACTMTNLNMKNTRTEKGKSERKEKNKFLEKKRRKEREKLRYILMLVHFRKKKKMHQFSLVFTSKGERILL